MNRNDRIDDMRDDKKRDFKQGKRGGKPKRNNSNGKPHSRRRDKECDSQTPDEPSNNPLWYVLDKEMMDVSSRLSFNNILGVTRVEGYREPLAMVRRLCPSPMINDIGDGSSTPYASKMTGINLAMYKLFNQLASTVGRVMQYAPQDLGIMILAMGELISMIEYVRRIMGVAYTYNAYNRAYPKGIIDMMGIDSDDLFANMANYRVKLNTIITSINAIPIPQNVAYFDKCATLYEHMYLDSASPTAQSMFDVPYSTWIIDETSYSGGTILKTVNVNAVPRPKRTLQDLIDKVIMPMVSALLNSSTLNLVYADILNMVAKTNLPLWKFDYISEGYTVMPEYSETYLMQVQNTTICGEYYAGSDLAFTGTVTPSNDVYPDASLNRLVHNPAFYHYTNGAMNLQGTETSMPTVVDLINMPDPNPSVEARVDMTRYIAFAPVVRMTGDSSALSYGAVLPDHFCRDILVYVDPSIVYDWKVNNPVHSTAAEASTNGILKEVITAFDWHPLLKYWDYNTSSHSLTIVHESRIVGDVNAITSFSRDKQTHINELYALGLFTVRT